MPKSAKAVVDCVDRLYRPGMFWDELYQALDEEGIDYEIKTVKYAVHQRRYKMRTWNSREAAEYIRGKVVEGMSIETMGEICVLEPHTIYAAVIHLGMKRPKHRHRMNTQELFFDLLMLENHKQQGKMQNA